MDLFYNLPVPKSAAVNVRLEEPVDRELEALAQELGTTKSALIRLLTQTFIRDVKQRGLRVPVEWMSLLQPADGRSVPSTEDAPKGKQKRARAGKKNVAAKGRGPS